MSIENPIPSLAFCAGIALLFALTFTAAPSRAETAIAADIDFAVPVDTPAESGGGFAIRLGQELHVPLVVLTPEIAFSYHAFSGDYAPEVYRGIAGLRLGIGEVFRGGIFGHLGVGWFEIDVSGTDPSHTAFTYDGGVMLDFTLLPLLNLGVHAAYNHVNGGDHASGFQWVSLGAHVALVF
jgi:hypothetical protein